jgi:hypothetical protein
LTALSPFDHCPACGHSLATHYVDLGCLDGWEWSDGLTVSEEGCDCHLNLCQEAGGRPFEVHR